MFRSITKRELLVVLRDVPNDGIVTFSSDYGDHSHTQQIHSLDGEVDQRVAKENAYSTSGYALRSEEYDLDLLDEDEFHVWVIR